VVFLDVTPTRVLFASFCTSLEQRQWFIVQTRGPCQLQKVDHKNYYGDGDTVKTVHIDALAPETEWTEAENDGTNWQSQCDYQSEKTSSWQKNLNVTTTVQSRWWRFTVTAAWGGEGNYICWDDLRLHGEVDDADDADAADDLEPRRMISHPCFPLPLLCHVHYATVMS